MRKIVRVQREFPKDMTLVTGAWAKNRLCCLVACSTWNPWANGRTIGRYTTTVQTPSWAKLQVNYGFFLSSSWAGWNRLRVGYQLLQKNMAKKYQVLRRAPFEPSIENLLKNSQARDIGYGLVSMS